jgi:DNA-binding MurR/RpiR family transcriptional regulator
VLFTDHLLSPLAADAAVVLVTTLDTGSPFSVMSPALAAVETVLVTVVDRLGGAPTTRMERYDELSTEVVPARLPDAPDHPADRPGGPDERPDE